MSIRESILEGLLEGFEEEGVTDTTQLVFTRKSLMQSYDRLLRLYEEALVAQRKELH